MEISRKLWTRFFEAGLPCDVLPSQMSSVIKTTSHCSKTLTIKVSIIYPLFTPRSHIDTKETERRKLMLCYLSRQKKYKEMRMCI